MPKSTVESVLQKSFRAWHGYLADRNFLANQLVFNSAPLPECNGTEDLKFYLGVENEEVLAAKKAYENPLAFAERIAYDVKNKWGKGFIWITSNGSLDPEAEFPRWTVAERLQAMVMHELGHVLGCGHMGGTIMREDLGDHLRYEAWDVNSVAFKRLTTIDGERELFSGGMLSAEYRGVISYSQPPEQIAGTFRRFVGRDPKGKIFARLKFGDRTVLALGDEAGVSEFVLPRTRDFARVASDAVVFKRADYDPKTDSSNGYGVALVRSGVKFTTLQASDGTTYMVTVELNTEEVGPVKVKYIHENQRIDLFQTLEGGSLK